MKTYKMYLYRGRSRFQCLLHGTTFLILVLHLAPIFKKNWKPGKMDKRGYVFDFEMQKFFNK